MDHFGQEPQISTLERFTTGDTGCIQKIFLCMLLNNRPTTAVIREHKRTHQIYLNTKSDSIFIENVVPIWNTFPKN